MLPMRNAELGMRNERPKFRIPNSAFRIPHSEFRIPNCKHSAFESMLIARRRAGASCVQMIAVLTPKDMAEPAWMIKWRAREALKNGQPDEAHRLLDALIAGGDRRAFALRADVIRGYLERAEKALR